MPRENFSPVNLEDLARFIRVLLQLTGHAPIERQSALRLAIAAGTNASPTPGLRRVSGDVLNRWCLNAIATSMVFAGMSQRHARVPLSEDRSVGSEHQIEQLVANSGNRFFRTGSELEYLYRILATYNELIVRQPENIDFRRERVGLFEMLEDFHGAVSDYQFMLGKVSPEEQAAIEEKLSQIYQHHGVAPCHVMD